jgi:hypothetical protein
MQMVQYFIPVLQDLHDIFLSLLREQSVRSFKLVSLQDLRKLHARLHDL